MRAPWIAAAFAAACATRPMPPPAPLSVPAPAPHTAPLPQLGGGGMGGPLFATALGDHRFDAKLDDLSPDAHRKVIDALAQLRAELTTLAPSELSAEEQLTLEMLRRQLADADAVEACSAPGWVVDQMS